MPEEPLTPRELRREVAFAVLAVASLVIGLYRIGDPGAPVPLWVMGLDVLIGAAFALDYGRRVHRSDRRLRYALTHAYEIVAFVPYTLIPQAGGGDVLRGARLFRLFRFLRLGAFAKVGLGVSRLPRRLRHVQRVARHAQIATLLLVGLLIVVGGGTALLAAEHATNPRARTFADGVWWSLNLFTTVAYDVPPPSTPAGYLVSGALMVTGIGFIGVLTASLANALLRTPEEGDEEG